MLNRYEYTHEHDRYWRKNLRKTTGTCIGVGLNRNWGSKWGGNSEDVKDLDIEDGKNAYLNKGPEQYVAKTH